MFSRKSFKMPLHRLHRACSALLTGLHVQQVYSAGYSSRPAASVPLTHSWLPAAASAPPHSSPETSPCSSTTGPASSGSSRSSAADSLSSGRTWATSPSLSSETQGALQGQGKPRCPPPPPPGWLGCGALRWTWAPTPGGTASRWDAWR